MSKSVIVIKKSEKLSSRGIFIPLSLVQAVGSDRAFVLQQIWFFTDPGGRPNENNLIDGYYWVHKTIKQWREDELPWMSRSTIQRCLADLKDWGLIVATNKFNLTRWDKTIWYRVDHEALDRFKTPPKRKKKKSLALTSK